MMPKTIKFFFMLCSTALVDDLINDLKISKGFYFSDGCLRGYFSFDLPLKQRRPISLQSSERSIFVRQTKGVHRFFPWLP
jgi:hypothetical protein